VIFMVGFLPLVVAGFGAVLAPTAPGRPSEPVPDVLAWPDEQGGEQRGDFVAGERDLPGRGWVAGVLGGRGDGAECVAGMADGLAGLDGHPGQS